MPIRFSDLANAFEFVSGGRGENQAYVDLRTGDFHYHSDLVDTGEELPEDVDSDHYRAIPDKRDLDLGRRVALDFAREHLGDDFGAVQAIFSRKGAYARFKDLLIRRGALDRWYEFSNAAEEAALRDWCASEELEVID